MDPPGAAGGRLAILGYVAFYQDAMNKWLEEDEEAFGHPHDSYHRVDVLESSRHVKVSLNGEVVAETGLLHPTAGGPLILTRAPAGGGKDKGPPVLLRREGRLVG